MNFDTIIHADALSALQKMPDCCVDCCVTNPPYYGLRDYGVEGQIGLECSPDDYISRLAVVFHEVKRVLKDNGTLWLNIGDSYSGSHKGAAMYPDNARAYLQGTNKGTLDNPAIVLPRLKGYKEKDLIGIPWMLAFALRADGWYLRQDIIWYKPNPMPESVTDRCTKSHEYIFLLSKSSHYYFDAEAISEPVADSTVARMKQGIESQKGSQIIGGGYKEPMKAKAPRYGGKKYTLNPCVFYKTKSGNAYDLRERRNKRSVWEVSTKPSKEAHFATFPPELIKPCILAGSNEGGVVLDPFIGSGTTGIVANKLSRHFIGIDLNKEYCDIARRRINADGGNLFL